MNLELLLPFEVFAEVRDVSRIVVETLEGSFGILPQRLDCVAALSPGILIYETPATGEAYVAVDGGVLVKAGPDVQISTRRAMRGADLRQLRDAVELHFLRIDEREASLRAVMAKLETGFLRRFASLQRD
jgi:F-type H+-transporting ATPase subunit epsilon